jgi:hypothetical protein
MMKIVPLPEVFCGGFAETPSRAFFFARLAEPPP